MEHRERILIVDDNLVNVKILNDLLKSNYKTSVATNGYDALEVVFSKNKPDLILLDVMMPEMDGRETCRTIMDSSDAKDIPIIFVTGKTDAEDEKEGLELGAVDYITKPIKPEIVLARVRTHLELKNARQRLKNQNKILEEMVWDQTKEVLETRLQIIQRLGRAAEYKDNETGMHVIRMSRYSQAIARVYGMSEKEVDLILHAAPMHDIGKIGVPDNVLLKPGRLNGEEWEVMKRHPEIGADIIADHPSELLQAAKIAALTHHEKWNGEGYPKGLKGKEIPIIGRIVAIADVFDALTSKRPYKEAWPVDDALELIKGERGEHFDPELVDAFLKIVPEAIKIKEEFKD